MCFLRHITSVSAALLALCVHAVEPVPPSDVLSFEEGTDGFSVSKKGSLTLSTDHSKYGSSSLLWEWSKAGSSISLQTPVAYLKENPNPKETSVSSFVFWVYSDAPQSGKIEFAFYKGEKKCCRFEYGLDFSGWRGAWVAFDRDMQGVAEEGMDRIVITAPQEQKKGHLYFDGIIPASFQDVRHHTADFQAPFINAGVSSHWLVLNEDWNLKLDIAEKPLTESDVKDMGTVEVRFIELVAKGRKPKAYDVLKDTYNSYGITVNENGTVKGKPVFFTRYGETFINIGDSSMSAKWAANGQLLRAANDFMYELAVAHMNETDAERKQELASMYLMMTRHLLDQGFAAGSAQGTLHHLGYSMRNFYTAPVIMKEVLTAAGLASEVQRAMEWFSGVGEVKTAPTEPGMDIDAFNTSLMGRVASIIMLEDSPYKHAYLRALSRWVDNGMKYTEGLNACFKRDGTVVHHRKAYPAYAVGGMDGAVKAVWMFNGTSLAISRESHSILKNALLELRFYSNKVNFPLAMSGRHPNASGKLMPEQYARLADAGTPDGKEGIDPELASAYLRLAGGRNAWVNKFIKAGILAETSPEGTRVYPYASVLVHREDDRSVVFAGHSRYIWAAETYQSANLYGRYIAHGSMQVLNGVPMDYRQEGFDWRHIPGTTATCLPDMKDMRSEVLNVDEFSGYEEMLLSDEWFAGGLSHGDRCGLYAMKLHEHDKYNGTLRARKSYFVDGGRIVSLGSDIENGTEDEVHTTLFQNPLASAQTSGTEIIPGMTSIYASNGLVYMVKDAQTVLTRGIQKSLDQSTDVPTEGLFETAYINHGSKVGGAGYEYLALAGENVPEVMPYEVLKKDRDAHVVRFDSGIEGYAVFEDCSSLPGRVLSSTAGLIMCGGDSSNLLLSVTNPDLALYQGESDEIFDGNGKRKERSIYGREWVNNPASPTEVSLVLDGEWALKEASDAFVLNVVEGKTEITVRCFEAMTEETVLIRK